MPTLLFITVVYRAERSWIMGERVHVQMHVFHRGPSIKRGLQRTRKSIVNLAIFFLSLFRR